ncbi:MAG: hypothetical protein LBI84_05150 [Propionibacteriaceae bacterium]|jgi:hypothetical protein|nr:hypothetical protein [Propionibacteriaceae bacterium]
MVSAAFLEQVRAMSVDERWEIVDAVLETIEPGYSPEELEIAREGLRRYRANPEATVDAEEFLGELARRYT